MTPSRFLWLALASLAGCSSDPAIEPDDAAPDAALLDAASSDAGPPDATPRDAATDAGVLVDAAADAPADAGAGDAGIDGDAGTNLDAGPPDAGDDAGADAGAPDAGDPCAPDEYEPNESPTAAPLAFTMTTATGWSEPRAMTWSVGDAEDWLLASATRSPTTPAALRVTGVDSVSETDVELRVECLPHGVLVCRGPGASLVGGVCSGRRREIPYLDVGCADPTDDLRIRIGAIRLPTTPGCEHALRVSVEQAP